MKVLFTVGHYLLQHIWDIIIAGLIVYEIVVHTSERRRDKQAAETAERQPPAIYDHAGNSGPVPIGGRAAAQTGVLSGPKEIDCSGMVRIVTFIDNPMKISPRYLLIDGRKATCQIFFRSATTGHRIDNLIVGGRAPQQCELVFRFPEGSVPGNVPGTLYLESSNRGAKEEDLFRVEVMFRAS